LTVPASISPYNNPVLNVTESNQNCVRNIKAFQIFQSFFLSSKYDEIKLKILDNILSIYASNYLNFLLLQQLHTLAHFIEDFENQSNEVKVGKSYITDHHYHHYHHYDADHHHLHHTHNVHHS
jgi:hypothetical protein